MFSFLLGYGVQHPIKYCIIKQQNILTEFTSPQIQSMQIRCRSPKSYDQFQYNLLLFMGSICSNDTKTGELPENNFDFVFDEDKYETRINHDDSIVCKNKRIAESLEDCENKLKKSCKLYKDPTMKSEPLVLKATHGRDFQVACTFERPYVFLRDSPATKNKKYPIFDPKDSNPSQIVIRDQVMQYFGVFLCFLAENPHLLDRIILTEANSYGVNVIAMNVRSKHEYIYIDDYILCYQKKPLFCQPANGTYTWPCLLEKAWFKVKGNIVKKIEKNTPEEVIHAFLPFPTQKIRLQSPDHTYNLLEMVKNLKYNQHEKGTIVTSKKEPSHKLGISGRKHFYLLKVFMYNEKNLLYLRNPCGLFDFRGIYSVIPPDLAQLIKKETGDERIPDGNFILEDEEFLEQIDEFLIIDYSKQSEHASETTINCELDQQQFVQFDLKANAAMSVSFNQAGYKNKEDLFSVPITYQIISLDETEIVSELNDHEGCFGETHVNMLPGVYRNLRAGQYLIRIKKKSPNSLEHSRLTKAGSDRIVITAPDEVYFDNKTQAEYKKIFNDFLVAKGRKELAVRNPRSKRLKEDIEHVSYWLGDMAVVYVEQTNPAKSEIRVEARFPDLKNLECATQRLSRQYTCLDPFQGHLLLVFEKVNLIDETVLGKYMIQSF